MRRQYWLVPLLAIAAMAVNVISSIAVVWFYSSFVAPGHEASFYEDFAQWAAPISSVVAGVPILFAAGWIAARACMPRGLGAGVAVAVVYIAIDTAALVAVQAGGDMWLVVVLSFATKLAAAALGAWVGSRRPAS